MFKSCRITAILTFCLSWTSAMPQSAVSGALPSYNDGKAGKMRQLQYHPEGDALVCENGTNRFTRALYGSPTDWRIETSDRPVFAIVKKNHHRHLRFIVNNIPLDSTDYCRATYCQGQRNYRLRDKRWGEKATIELQVVACPDREGAVWWFHTQGFDTSVKTEARLCEIAQPKLQRNGDIGADKPGVFEAAPGERGLKRHVWQTSAPSRRHKSTDQYSDHYFVVDTINRIANIPQSQARQRFAQAVSHNRQLAARLSFITPDPYINALGSALVFAADGDWDGQSWLHGCIGWRTPLAGWRAAYVGDVLGWNDRQRSHFSAYAQSQVTNVPPVKSHPTQDPKMQMARADKQWGTQMYSNGYICRNPGRNDQMHHYDMNLNYIDELLWHFQYNADTTYMRRMWPVIKSHLAWEKRNFDPDGDHLYDAYCCIWASDALYYSGGAVTHSSAYNYRGNRLAARIAQLIGEDPAPYQQEANAILRAMDERLWLATPGGPYGEGHWAEYQEALGLRRRHESAAVWSIYTPVDCGACSPLQAWHATDYVSRHHPHLPVDSVYQTISTTDWMPYSWSINNVAAAEVMHTALAYFEAGRADEGFQLMKANIMDNMYYGQSPANFGQLSHLDTARGECYRDFGDVIGISSRTLIQGLFGVVPDALWQRCFIRPGFPEEWDSVALHTPYISYTYTRDADSTHISIEQHFSQPLRIIVRQQLSGGRVHDIPGTDATRQVISFANDTTEKRPPLPPTLEPLQQLGEDERGLHPQMGEAKMGLLSPDTTRAFHPYDISKHFNAGVSDIFRNRYESPRPLSTTLQIPLQGVGEWCHPQYTPVINDSVFRSLILDGKYIVAGVPFLTPATGHNIVYTSLFDNYPNEIVIPITSPRKQGKYNNAYLLMAGSTNHMQSRIDNGMVIATYADGSTDTLLLRNPDNWCPIEQDYFIDNRAFSAPTPRPYRLCLSNGVVSRDLGQALHISGVYGREIPGGAAQMLRMRLHPGKRLHTLTLRTLSCDVVIGLMALTLQ